MLPPIHKLKKMVLDPKRNKARIFEAVPYAKKLKREAEQALKNREAAEQKKAAGKRKYEINHSKRQAKQEEKMMEARARDKEEIDGIKVIFENAKRQKKEEAASHSDPKGKPKRESKDKDLPPESK